MLDFQEKAWDVLCEQDGETVARLLTQYHGKQLLDKGFLEHLKEEGYVEEDEDEDEDEDEEEGENEARQIL
jgi:hypothetical protein